MSFQGIVKGFKENGFQTQSQPLSNFYESYGLESDDEDEDMEDIEGEDDSDDSIEGH
jgi:hypothetical protein